MCAWFGCVVFFVDNAMCSGEMLGMDQPIHLRLIETEQGMKPLKGVMMELEDGAFPLLSSVTGTKDLTKGFGDVDYAILAGAAPRGPGMERKDLLAKNASIFAEQGKALNHTAKATAKILVVGNPANTNAMVAAANAPRLWEENFMAMTRLDQSRARAMVAEKCKVDVKDVDRVTIWGNHSSTQYPDLSHARVKGEWAPKVINDTKWIRNEFVPRVQKRGAEVIGARGASSAASAASAAVDSIRDLHVGSGDTWQSHGIISDGSYGIEKGIWYSVPTHTLGDTHYRRVRNIPIDEYSAKMMSITEKELIEERDAVRHLIPSDYGKTASLGDLTKLKNAWEAKDGKALDALAKSLPVGLRESIKERRKEMSF